MLKFIIFFLFFPPAFLLSLDNNDTVYVLRGVDFEVNGRSRPFALISHGEFVEGERIIGEEALHRYIATRRQLLLNQRVLEDVIIEYSLGEREEDDALPLHLHVFVRDSWNIIVLPYPEYDSNEGFSLTFKARDYNFLGTMSPLRFDLGYNHHDGVDTLNFSIESETPFEAAGLEWRFRFDHFFSYIFGETLYYQNVSGISVLLPWELTTLTIGLNQYLTVNEENSDENREYFGLDSRFFGPYASTEIFASWEIPLGIEIGDFGMLNYIPTLSERINYPYENMDDTRKPVTSLGHSLGFGRINWIGNYRRGLSASVEHNLNWFKDRSDAPLRITLEGDLTLHWPFSRYFGLSSRLNYQQWWHWSDQNDNWLPYYYGGDRLRGILNEHIRAERMISFNLDLPVRLMRFFPSEWLNRSGLRVFDFEMHLSPFTDMAVVQGPESGYGYILHSAGLEAIVFPGLFRSLYLRVSLGYNVDKLRSEGIPPRRLGIIPRWDEIFIGLEHHY